MAVAAAEGGAEPASGVSSSSSDDNSAADNSASDADGPDSPATSSDVDPSDNTPADDSGTAPTASGDPDTPGLPDTSDAADGSEPAPPTPTVDTPEPETPSGTTTGDAPTPTPDEPSRSTPTGDPESSEPNTSASDTDTDSDAGTKSNAPLSPTDTPVTDQTPPVFTLTVDSDVATNAPIISAATTAALPAGVEPNSLFYALRQSGGVEGLVLFNQGAMLIGVLNRRSRGDDEYLELIAPGDSRFIPARTMAEGSLGKHHWDDEADLVTVDDAMIQRFFDTTLIRLPADAEESPAQPTTFRVTSASALSQKSFFGVGPVDLLNMSPEELEEYHSWLVSLTVAENATDPTDQFVNYGDADWGAGFTGSAPPPGITYSVPADGSGAFTLHNNSDVDIAIANLNYPNYSDQGLTIIRSGDSHTVARASLATPLGFSAYIVQAPRVDGSPTVIGRIIVTPSDLLGDTIAVGSATESIHDYIPLASSSPVDFAAVDPDDRFYDSGDATYVENVVTGNPVTAGVSYSVVDEDHVTVYNDGTDDIAITRGTPGGQTLTYDILTPGESATYATVPGSWQILSVQAPKAPDGSMVMLGSIINMPTGPQSNSPSPGIPGIPLRDAPPVTNHAPTGSLVEISRSDDGRSVTFRAEATDPDGDLITYSVLMAPSKGTVVHNNDGTFTYTVTDPGYLHYGSVWDLFVVGASDGINTPTGLAAEIDIEFTQVNNAPEVTVTPQEHPNANLGFATYLVNVNDADWGQFPDWIGFDQIRYSTTTPSVGSVEIVRWSDRPVEIRYTPDLVRAHESAYDTTFDVIVSDGHDGGTVTVPISIHVPFYNQNPTAEITPVAGSGGKFVGDAAFTLTLEDADNDEVTVVSITTSNGGTATLHDGVIIYTPQASPDRYGYNQYSHYDRIIVVVDDGHGGVTTTTHEVRIADTSAFTWLEPGQERILIFSGTSELSTVASRLVTGSTPIRSADYQDQIAQLEAGFAPELDGYSDSLQRYLVQNYAWHVIKDALVAVSQSIARVESVVRSIDIALQERGFASRVTTRIALEFLTGFRRTLFGQVVAVSGSEVSYPPRDYEPEEIAPSVDPLSTSQLFTTLWSKTNAQEPFYIEHVEGADGVYRMIVYVGGTATESGAVQSMFENYGAIHAVGDLDFLDAILAESYNENYPNAGKDKEILLVGYSQGGIDSINLANSDLLNVAGVVTFGTPLHTASVDYPAIHIRDERDEIAWIGDGKAESFQRSKNQIFQGRASTPDNWFTPDVHSNYDTHVEMGKKFDDALANDTSTKYRGIRTVLKTFNGEVKGSASHGESEENRV
ncbi:cadherin-like domain-containing protein [Gordonia terrae]